MSFIPESEIQDSETLYRAIHPSFWNYEEDKPTSALFKDRKGVSVDREGNRSNDDAVNFLLSSRQNFGAGKLNAGQTRRVGTYLKPDKTPENVFHALILESESKILLSSRKAKELSRMINIITPPVNNKPTQSS
ncbi:MAG: hypothetical protein AB1432_13765 [Bacteroidota bacterium]|jgi:hypothetical protein